MTDITDRPALLAAIVALAEAGGDIVWRHFTAGCAVMHKSDESPVTAADRDAEAAILAGLAIVAPAIPVVAEEQAAAGDIPAVADAFFLVDPLDGTKEFVRRGDDFTVNIALVEHGVPTMGVVYAPARDALYWGDVAQGAAWTAARAPGGDRGAAQPIRVRRCGGKPCAVASKSHAMPGLDEWLDAGGVSERVAVGSSLKFALVACGEADVYPRTGPTMEWDTAAGDAVLRAAGGRTLDVDGAPFTYGKPGYRNAGFVATGGYQPAPLRPYLR
ncbi:3'(2'),5'-bisphosphate nucleotidase CysQ [Sphingomonas yunnanensis]|uniref:3'(2'),5'-bisphosphate nucleotidase CysQ n=1 Tax=Sphingomonas yunnanensis TaxID=310400 RepID=UPI001CA6A2CA|nr:3'(2'),5'-bisphosphate nucleotidase CysQ [Sphingomonas yunnanensis]MBY9064494.1 3'(2'),5'-bisphosphate nucleotidase CysQ [Sphingomonas yunnanensis]